MPYYRPEALKPTSNDCTINRHKKARHRPRFLFFYTLF
ncbi:hypothetical protein BN136_3068 [Cronobacter universalis NCTC 9529]|nr:hypothetical protein BN136_3068 [Cronobacter universalis NCTC 9529]